MSVPEEDDDMEIKLDFITANSPLKIKARRKYGYRPLTRKQYIAMNSARADATRNVKVSLPKLKFMGDA